MSRLFPLAFVIAVLGLLAPACGEREADHVIVKHEGQEEEVKSPPALTPEEAFELRKKAREEAPEPKLNPDEPREKFELVWRKGRTMLRSIHHERYDILERMKEITFEKQHKAYEERFKPLIEELREYTIGRKSEDLETAAERLCKLIDSVRGPSETMIEEGNTELEKIVAEIKVLEEKQAAGETVYQRDWDKLTDQKKAWSRPVEAGKFVFLAIKSMLDEAYVLADYGPRRAQIALRDCLTEVARAPLPYDLAQGRLERVIERSKYYRDLR